MARQTARWNGGYSRPAGRAPADTRRRSLPRSICTWHARTCQQYRPSRGAGNVGFWGQSGHGGETKALFRDGRHSHIRSVGAFLGVREERRWVGISHSLFLAARSALALRLWWKLTFRRLILRRRSSHIRAPISLGRGIGVLVRINRIGSAGAGRIKQIIVRRRRVCRQGVTQSLYEKGANPIPVSPDRYPTGLASSAAGSFPRVGRT